MRYVVRQKFFSLGDSFAIKDEFANDIFIVRSQLLSFGKKLRIFDLLDNELCYIEQRLFRFLPEYDVYIAGEHVANIKKKFAFLKHDFSITSTYGNYEIEGDFWAHEFEIIKNGSLVARISKKFFSFTDTYGVDIDDSQDQMSNLALAIVIDMVCHDDER
jgi:uncharacterized protein YxjI